MVAMEDHDDAVSIIFFNQNFTRFALFKLQKFINDKN